VGELGEPSQGGLLDLHTELLGRWVVFRYVRKMDPGPFGLMSFGV
jgi:hypothetical protein